METNTETYLYSPGCQHNAPHSLLTPPFDRALAPVMTFKKKNKNKINSKKKGLLKFPNVEIN